MNTCNYMTYQTGPLTACGKPATHKTAKPIGKTGHRFYCTDCARVIGQPGGIPLVPLNEKEIQAAARKR